MKGDFSAVGDGERGAPVGVRMVREARTRLAITEVVTESLGGTAHVALSPREITPQQRKQLKRRHGIKPAKMLAVPCQVNIDLTVAAFPGKKHRSEAWLYINDVIKEPEKLILTCGLLPVTVELGQPIRLRCHVQPYSAEQAITWFRDNVELSGDRYHTRRECNAEGEVSLLIDQSEVKDAGEYLVRVSGQDQSIESSTGVTVLYERPTFTKPLNDIKCKPGSPAIFSCVVQGLPTPKTSWLVSGIEVEPSSKRYRVSAGPRDYEHQLTVEDVGLEDEKKLYTCHSWNEVGEDQTSGKVILQDPAHFTQPLRDAVEVRRGGGPYEMHVRAVGWPEVNLTWKVDGVPVDGRGRYRVETGRWDPTTGGSIQCRLVVDQVTRRDGGTVVEVVAANEAGKETSTTTLSIKPEAPQFVELFHDQNVEEAQTLKMSAKVIGEPKPTIKWMREDGLLLNGVAGYEITPCEREGGRENNGEEEDEEEEGRCSLIVRDVSKAMTGLFKCVAENIAGDAKCVARITVTEKLWRPVFIDQLTDQESVEDGQAKFVARVNGYPLPHITWFYKECELKDDGLSMTSVRENDVTLLVTLTLDHLTLSDGGKIKLLARNSRGEADSVSNLSVAEKLWYPVILEQLIDVEAIEDGQAEFRCKVTSKPPAEITWSLEGVELREGNKTVLLTTERQPDRNDTVACLTFNKLSLKDDGKVKIKAVNTEGEASSIATLTVKEKLWSPSFVDNIMDYKGIEDGQAMFSCTVNSKPPAEIFWYLNGAELKTTDRHLITSRIDKCLQQVTLQLHKLKLTDAGQIKIRAINLEGEISSTATLAVKEKLWSPLFGDKLIDYEGTEDEEAFFSCTVNSKPTAEISWFCNNIQLTSSDTVTIVSRLDNNDQYLSLKLDKISLGDSGQVEVKAKNSEGQETSTAELTVKEKLWCPVILQQLADVEVIEDGLAEFRCTVHSKPHAQITWYADNVELKSSNTIKITSTDMRNNEVIHCLELDKLTLKEAGQDIKIKAVNSEGEASSTATLTIREKLWPPLFIDKLDDYEGIEEGQATFSCTVSCKPAPQISWYADETELQPSETLIINCRPDDNGFHLRLTLDCLKLSDAGQIMVKAFNPLGDVCSTAKLTVKEKLWSPSFIDNIMDYEAIEDGQAMFSCTVNSKPPAEIFWYLNGAELKTTDRHLITSRIEKCSQQVILQLHKLKLTDAGQIKITAINSEGEISSTATLAVKEKLWSPLFTDKLVDYEGTEDEEAFFSCTVNSKPTAEISWFRNNIQLTSSDTVTIVSRLDNNDQYLSLKLDKISLGDSGQVEVKAKNSEGQETSTAELTVKENFQTSSKDAECVNEAEVRQPVIEKLWCPVILEQLADMEVIEDGLAEFRCAVNSKPRAQITWYADNVELKSSNTIKITSTDMRNNEVIHCLELDKLTLKEAGQDIKIKAVNSEGEASSTATLTIREKLWSPLFIEKLADYEEIEGGEATFRCRVSGRPAPQISWYLNNEELTLSNMTIVDVSRDQDDVVASLKLVKLRLVDAGPVKVRALNSEGEVSSVVKLTVNEKLWAPVIIDCLIDCERLEHETAQFSCTVNAKPKPNITWFLEDVEVRPSETTLITCVSETINNNNNDNKDDFLLGLKLDKLSLKDAGSVKVKAVNSEGGVSCTATLIVKEKLWCPLMLEQLIDIDALEDGQAEFRCKITSKPPANIIWCLNGETINQTETVTITSSQDGDDQVLWLKFSKLRLADAGVVQVKASNVEGEVNSVAKLTVKEKLWAPVFLNGLNDVESVEESLCEFVCTVNAKPLPSIIWCRNDHELQPSNRVQITSSPKNSDIVLSLKLDRLILEDGGQIRVKARNSEGEAITTANLTIKEKLWPPLFVDKLEDYEGIEEGQATFSCTVNCKPAPQIFWYLDNVELKPSERISLSDSKEGLHRLRTSLKLNQLQLQDAGKVTVKATNSEGEVSYMARLSVKEKLWAPFFIDVLSDCIAPEDDVVLFACKASGKPPPKITWCLNDVELARSDTVEINSKGEKNDVTPSLQLNKVKPTDSGKVKIKLQNSEGEVSATAMLTVNEKLWAPVILDGLVECDELEGGLATFGCSITAKPQPIVTWYLKGFQLKQSDTVMISASCDNNKHELGLKLDKLTLEDGGEVKVTALNSEGEVSSVARLTVREKLWAPIFKENLVDWPGLEEGCAKFTCTLNGKPTPLLTWYLNESELSTASDRVTIKSDSIDSNNDQRHCLELNGLSLHEEGRVRVHAVNSEGEASSVARLTVREKLWMPFFIDGLSDFDGLEEEQAEFVCRVSSKPTPTISWYLNDQQLRPSDNAVMTTNTDGLDVSLHLTLKKLRLEDAGQVKVTAHNSEGEENSVAWLTVKEKLWCPLILEQLIDIDALEDGQAEFRCKLTSKPAAQITWSLNERELKPNDTVTYTSIPDHNDVTLVIRLDKLKVRDSGKMTLKALNSEGEATSNAALNIKEKLWCPFFLEQLADFKAIEDGQAEFRCQINSKPPAEITWLLNGDELKVNDAVIITADTENNIQNLSLMLDQLKLTDAGQVKVVVRNSEGEANSTAILSVKEKLWPPLFVEPLLDHDSLEGGQVIFNCKVIGKPSPTITWYRDNIEVIQGNNCVTAVTGNTDDGFVASLKIADLSVSDACQVKVSAANIEGSVSSVARLLISAEPSYFTRMLEDVSVNEGMPAVFTCQVHPSNADVTWYIDDEQVTSDNHRYIMSSEGDERVLEIVRTKRADTGRVTCHVGDLQSYAELTIEASETEMVETRLFYEIEEDRTVEVAIEFLCLHGSDLMSSATMELQTSDRPGQVMTEQVESAAQRRWVVKKAYICRDGKVRVDRWTVQSFVDYVCSAEGLVNVSLGILDDVRFSTQTVEFQVLLTNPSPKTLWLKDGKRVPPPPPSFDSSSSFYSSSAGPRKSSVMTAPTKYSSTVSSNGLLHTLSVSDVQPSDRGVYTFKVAAQERTARVTKLEAARVFESDRGIEHQRQVISNPNMAITESVQGHYTGRLQSLLLSEQHQRQQQSQQDVRDCNYDDQQLLEDFRIKMIEKEQQHQQQEQQQKLQLEKKRRRSQEFVRSQLSHFEERLNSSIYGSASDDYQNDIKPCNIAYSLRRSGLDSIRDQSAGHNFQDGNFQTVRPDPEDDEVFPVSDANAKTKTQDVTDGQLRMDDIDDAKLATRSNSQRWQQPRRSVILSDIMLPFQYAQGSPSNGESVSLPPARHGCDADIGAARNRANSLDAGLAAGGIGRNSVLFGSASDWQGAQGTGNRGRRKSEVLYLSYSESPGEGSRGSKFVNTF